MCHQSLLISVVSCPVVLSSIDTLPLIFSMQLPLERCDCALYVFCSNISIAVSPCSDKCSHLVSFCFLSQNSRSVTGTSAGTGSWRRFSLGARRRGGARQRTLRAGRRRGAGPSCSCHRRSGPGSSPGNSWRQSRLLPILPKSLQLHKTKGAMEGMATPALKTLLLK